MGRFPVLYKYVLKGRICLFFYSLVLYLILFVLCKEIGLDIISESSIQTTEANNSDRACFI